MPRARPRSRCRSPSTHHRDAHVVERDADRRLRLVHRHRGPRSTRSATRTGVGDPYGHGLDRGRRDRPRRRRPPLAPQPRSRPWREVVRRRCLTDIGHKHDVDHEQLSVLTLLGKHTVVPEGPDATQRDEVRGGHVGPARRSASTGDAWCSHIRHRPSIADEAVGGQRVTGAERLVASPGRRMISVQVTMARVVLARRLDSVTMNCRNSVLAMIRAHDRSTGSIPRDEGSDPDGCTRP